MKKILLIAAVAAAVSGTTFAANVGVGLGTKESFVEASVLPKTTVGYARVYRDQYGHQNDLYAKYDVMGENLQVLGGWRNHMKGQNNSFYGGARSNRPLLRFSALCKLRSRFFFRRNECRCKL